MASKQLDLPKSLPIVTPLRTPSHKDHRSAALITWVVSILLRIATHTLHGQLINYIVINSIYFITSITPTTNKHGITYLIR